MSLRAFNHIDASKGDDDEVQCGTLLTDYAEPRVHVPFSFHRLSTDRRTAFFRSSASDEMDHDLIFDSIDELSPDVLNNASQIVQIRSSVHDIYIPDLKVDKASKEISFDWPNLFSLFFAEEKVYGRIMQRWVSCPAPRISIRLRENRTGRNLTGVNEKLETTGAPTAPVLQASTDYDIRDAGNILEKQMRVFMTQDKAARKQARRCRVRRQSQELKGEDLLINEDYSQIEKLP